MGTSHGNPMVFEWFQRLIAIHILTGVHLWLYLPNRWGVGIFSYFQGVGNVRKSGRVLFYG